MAMGRAESRNVIVGRAQPAGCLSPPANWARLRDKHEKAPADRSVRTDGQPRPRRV